VIARHPTLAALTRSVEGTPRRDPNLRALAIAVVQVEGFDELMQRSSPTHVRRRAGALQGSRTPQLTKAGGATAQAGERRLPPEELRK
jgi:hypothetical protein